MVVHSLVFLPGFFFPKPAEDPGRGCHVTLWLGVFPISSTPGSLQSVILWVPATLRSGYHHIYPIDQSLSACMQTFPDVRNLSSILYLSKMLLFVLLLFYFLSTPCAWYSCFGLKWTFFFIDFIFSESGAIVRKFPLAEPCSHWDYIFFLPWMSFLKKKEKSTSAPLQPSSHTLFLCLLALRVQLLCCCEIKGLTELLPQVRATVPTPAVF